MNILVTGSKGQLGSEIKEVAKQYEDIRLFLTDVEDLDITNQDAIETYISQNEINYIINCAAYTAVDKAESDKELCSLINSEAPKLLAQASLKYNIKLIHISTDYVFDGTNHQPYNESQSTNPKSYYGITKGEGEQNLLISNPNSIIIRTSWLYSSYGNNFIKTMARLGKERDSLNIVYDQVGTPTNAKDLAKAILEIIHKVSINEKNFVSGIYHYSNEGVCSWFDFAIAIFDHLNIDCKANPILSKEFPTPAPRPHYSVLDKEKIKSTYDITIPHWQKSLKESLDNANWSL